MKIRQVGTELLHADGRTDMTKLIVFLSQFCERGRQGQQFVLIIVESTVDVLPVLNDI
jgi:hypothetical protein